MVKKKLDEILYEEDEQICFEAEYLKDDNEIDETLWKQTFELLSKYGHKWAEIHALNHIWFYMTYGFEFGTEHEKSGNLSKMYKSAPMFFSISRIAIERTSRVELVKLFDSSYSVSIKYLREYLEKNASLICHNSINIDKMNIINRKLKNYLNEHSTSINALKKIRNKHLAHNDIQYFQNLENLYEEQKVMIQDIFEVIDCIGEYLDEMAQLMQSSNASASVCPKYNELMDIQSLEMYFEGK